jgi:hypothetical protein
MKQTYTNGTDRWLSPPDLLALLGEFDLDPCCEPWMPWRTAKRMLSLAPHGERMGRDGKVEVASIVPGDPRFTDKFVASEVVANSLLERWEGRVFMNHPYSCGLPWAEKFAAHGNGVALTASKSLDTEWGQLFLDKCDAVLFPKGRILFHYVDGTKSTGAFLPNALWAFGENEADLLFHLWLTGKIPGRVLRPWP